MRKTLSAFALLVAVTALAAQDPTSPPGGTADKPGEKAMAERRRGQERQEDLFRRAAELEDRVAALQQAKNEQAAEYQLRLASLEAEHKTRMAALDRDIQRATAEAEAVGRQLARARAEAARQQAGGVEPPARPRIGGGGFRGPAASADEKLDALMKKLEEMDARLMRLESQSRSRR